MAVISKMIVIWYPLIQNQIRNLWKWIFIEKFHLVRPGRARAYGKDRYSLLRLFTISELLAKSPNYNSQTDLENCEFTLSDTINFYEFHVTPGGVIGVVHHNLPINLPINMLINQLKTTLTQLNVSYPGYLELRTLSPNRGPRTSLTRLSRATFSDMC